MSSLYIRDVPGPVLEALKRLAQAHHRSLQGELLVLLERAAQEAPPASDALPLIPGRSACGGTWRREDLYEDAGR